MSRLTSWKQDPDERLLYEADYSQWLGETETISTASFSIEAVSPSGATAIIMDGYQLSADFKGVLFFIKGGVDGAQYKLHVTITTSSGNIKEVVIIYNIRSL